MSTSDRPLGRPLGAGHVVVVPFPYTDLSKTKRRPAFVLTPEGYNRGARDLLLAYVTSVPQEDRWAVGVTDEALASGSLPKPSWIRADKVFTLSQDLPRGPVAAVTAGVREAVRDRLRDLLVRPAAS